MWTLQGYDWGGEMTILRLEYSYYEPKARYKKGWQFSIDRMPCGVQARFLAVAVWYLLRDYWQVYRPLPAETKERLSLSYRWKE